MGRSANRRGTEKDPNPTNGRAKGASQEAQDRPRPNANTDQETAQEGFAADMVADAAPPAASETAGSRWKGRALLIAIPLVVVLALTAAIWWNQRPKAVETVGPELLTKPELGAALDSRLMFSERPDRGYLLEPFDQQTGLAVGLWGTDRLALAAFDLDTAKPQWQIELPTVLGDEPFSYTGATTVMVDGQGRGALQARTADGRDPLVVFDQSGQALQAARNTPGGLIRAQDGVMVFGVGGGTNQGWERLTAYRMTDITKPEWELDNTGGAALPQELWNPATKTWLFTTADGYVDARTGTETKFTDPDPSADPAATYRYLLADGPQDVLLRVNTTDRSFARVDLTSGAVEWAGPESVSPAEALVEAGHLLVADQWAGAGSQRPIAMVDVSTGEQLWLAQGEPLRLDAGRVLYSAGSELVAASPADGAVLARTSLGQGERVAGAGGSMAYSIRPNGLIRGLRMDGTGEVAWELSAGQLVDPNDTADSAYLVVWGQRLFVSEWVATADPGGNSISYQVMRQLK
ncbi:MAG: hypothetical protein LBH68_02825 [Bifidobacteriaceae bacterium]|nr:hypothetical protein [Bifidobacteriaceae bacterium]